MNYSCYWLCSGSKIIKFFFWIKQFQFYTTLRISWRAKVDLTKSFFRPYRIFFVK